MIITDELRQLLQEYLREHALNQREFGKLVGATGPTVSRWLSGEVTQLSAHHGARLAELLRLGEDYLQRPVRHLAPPPDERARSIRNTPALREFVMHRILIGGHDLRSVARLAGYDNVDTLKRLLAGELDWYPAMLSGVLTALGVDFEKAPLSPAERQLLHPAYGEGWQTRDVPVLTFAHAADCPVVNGILDLPNFWQGERYPVPTDGRRYVAFRVEGHSMDPLVRDGNIVLCDLDAQLANGQIVIARFDDQIVCKRYRAAGETVLLTSDNRAVGQDFELPRTQLDWILRAVRTITDL